ncbi:hypothetical protein B7463_g8584, partial [Scytalidium lignicola]
MTAVKSSKTPSTTSQTSYLQQPPAQNTPNLAAGEQQFPKDLLVYLAVYPIRPLLLSTPSQTKDAIVSNATTFTEFTFKVAVTTQKEKSVLIPSQSTNNTTTSLVTQLGRTIAQPSITSTTSTHPPSATKHSLRSPNSITIKLRQQPSPFLEHSVKEPLQSETTPEFIPNQPPNAEMLRFTPEELQQVAKILKNITLAA